MTFLSYKNGLPKIVPQMSSGTTYNSTSFMKLDVIANLILSCLATHSLALSQTQPKGTVLDEA